MNATHRLALEAGSPISADALDTFVNGWPDEAKASDASVLVRTAAGEDQLVAIHSIEVSWAEEL